MRFIIRKQLKDLLDKAKTITERISNTYINNVITTEYHQSMDSGGAIEKCIMDRTATNLPPKIGTDIHTTKISYSRSSSSPFSLIIQPQYVFIGGYGSKMGRATLTFVDNVTIYVYLSRDKDKYGVINIEQYDRLLGGDDRDIHFSRVLVMRVQTNLNGITDVHCYDVGNY